MANSVAELPDSDTQQPEMAQLKRKSLSESPEPGDGQGEAPNKRVKVEDAAHENPQPAVSETYNGNKANGSKDASQGAVLVNDAAISNEDNLSPTSRNRANADDAISSPEQRRRPSESRRRDSSPPVRSPDQDRRPSQTRRRSRSPARSPDQDRKARDYRRRDASPPRRERRDSEASRTHPANAQSMQDKDRNRRGSVVKEEEKKRGKRLFGGLISTLSQTTTNSQQKRRLEVEKRQQEKAAKQKTEDDLLRKERLAKLDEVRKIEQIRFDEQVMRTRHSNMLAMARGLQTESEPKLYYRPWELTKEQEDTIKDQIRDAEVQIDDELQQFKADKAHRLKELGVPLPASSDADAVVGEPAEEDSLVDAAQDESAATVTNDRKQSPSPAPVAEDKDQGEMVEAEEDTVIY